MPKIEIRPAFSTDVPKLISLEHNYTTNYVWQMTLNGSDAQTEITFREVRLPRAVHVTYPRNPAELADTWTKRDALLLAESERGHIGYISLKRGLTPKGAWVIDLVVDRTSRQTGVGSALMFAAEEWCAKQGIRRLTLEMQSKNYPTIQFAYKLGFDFCGYNDQYYPNQDIALFFSTYV
ncbi:MAG: GNAT family N-acetyltransferase [Chloroflexota bacterium]|nr:GNAT family N-acetyltransferase [Chloroflexota bacterium]